MSRVLPWRCHKEALATACWKYRLKPARLQHRRWTPSPKSPRRRSAVIPGRRDAANPESRSCCTPIEIPDQSALRTVRNDGLSQAAALFVAGTWWVSLQQARAQDWISHTHEVLAAIATTRADLVDIQNGQRGFVISGRPEDLQPYEEARSYLGLGDCLARSAPGDARRYWRQAGELFDRMRLPERFEAAERLAAADSGMDLLRVAARGETMGS